MLSNQDMISNQGMLSNQDMLSNQSHSLVKTLSYLIKRYHIQFTFQRNKSHLESMISLKLFSKRKTIAQCTYILITTSTSGILGLHTCILVVASVKELIQSSTFDDLQWNFYIITMTAHY